jgi:hypothetical protein
MSLAGCSTSIVAAARITETGAGSSPTAFD